MLTKIISGGQTGADQAGLLAARKCGVETGGTAPSEFYTGWGPNPLLESFGLIACGDYRSRTIKNIKDSDGTVLLTMTSKSPGSTLTRNESIRRGKPFLELDTNELIKAYELGTAFEFNAIAKELARKLSDFVEANGIVTLNVAGNREKNRKLLSTTYSVQMVVEYAILNGAK